MLRRWADPKWREKMTEVFNRPREKHTEATKEKIRALLTGKKLPQEVREKMSKTRLGKPTKKRGRHYPHLQGEKSHGWKGGYYVRQTIARAVRRVREREAGGAHTPQEWETVKAQYNWTCPCCRRSEPDIKLTKDHIIAVAKGGSNNIENIQPLCKRCNSKKRLNETRFSYEITMDI